MRNILVPLMDGFEEIEFVSIVDVLRRAGLNVIVAGCNDWAIGAHNITIKVDYRLEKVDIATLDSIVLAGGYGGMVNLCNNVLVLEIIQTLNKENKLIAAICASPIVLGKAGVLKNKFSCYPQCEDSIQSDARYTQELVCVDNNIITSIGPASAMLFALEVVKYLCGEEKYVEIRGELLVDIVLGIN